MNLVGHEEPAMTFATRLCVLWVLLLGLLVVPAGVSLGQEPDEAETIDSSRCIDCHEKSSHGSEIAKDLDRSIHADLVDCLGCHQDRGTIDTSKDPMHQRVNPEFSPRWDPCRECHEDAATQYQSHGREAVKTLADLPDCASCHGDHDILPSDEKLSRTHPVNLPDTCGVCHKNLDITRKYEILIDKAIEIYESSVHGQATKGGVYVAATCNDCHSTGGSAHKILSPGYPESSINHFNIPKTCGKCHPAIEKDYSEGIHGKLVARGETDAPVCTHCHGEHGIISPENEASPTSRARVAQETCAPCHESAVLNEKYGLAPGRLTTFIDSYHGLKSKAGDTHVANCASCHGVHRILPSTDPTSTIYPANLQRTCGECHPGISEAMANTPIHGVAGEGLRTKAAEIIERIYIVVIWVVIGGMVLHWLLDLGRQMKNAMTTKPQIRRMRNHEVWQHMLLMVSFIVLVISGFALRFSESWFARLFFWWDGGFQRRGTIHRFAAVVFIFTVIWHLIFIVASRRGRQFVVDMLPRPHDLGQFWRRILYNLGRRAHSPRFGRFSYVEKAEYWALVWGTIIMVLTGLMLWFDNSVVNYLPKGFLDVALVIHYWEAWLATLAILVWHLYSTVFSPHVYPMNPSWLTGTMPEGMYRHEHPAHVDEAKKETEELIRKQMESFRAPDPTMEGNGFGNNDDEREPKPAPDKKKQLQPKDAG